MKFVYVCSPLRGDIENNIKKAHVFDPNNYEIKRRIYGNTGGHCMVGTMEFYLPDIDRKVWVHCNDESVAVTTADTTWNEDGSNSYVCLLAGFRSCSRGILFPDKSASVPIGFNHNHARHSDAKGCRAVSARIVTMAETALIF